MRPIQQLARPFWPIFRQHELDMARRIKDAKTCRGSEAANLMHLKFHVQGARYWHTCILRARRT